MKNDIDVGKTFRAKQSITSSTVDPSLTQARTGLREKMYVEQGETVVYLGMAQTDSRVAHINLRGKNTMIDVKLFNSHFERA